MARPVARQYRSLDRVISSVEFFSQIRGAYWKKDPASLPQQANAPHNSGSNLKNPFNPTTGRCR